MYGSSNVCCDGYEGVGFPSIVLYSFNLWVIFGMFLCDGLFWETIMTVCESYELYCDHGGWCHRCLCVVWGPD
jgi:hypothetical protein